MPRVHYHRHVIISSNAITVKPALTDVSYLEPMRYRAKDRARPVANPSGRSVWPAEACRNTPYDVAVSRKRTLSTGYGPDGTDRKDGRGNRQEAATDRLGYREMIDVGVNLSTNPPPAPAALRARRLPLLADPARPPQTAIVRQTRHLRILYRKHGAGCGAATATERSKWSDIGRIFRPVSTISNIAILLDIRNSMCTYILSKLYIYIRVKFVKCLFVFSLPDYILVNKDFQFTVVCHLYELFISHSFNQFTTVWIR